MASSFASERGSPTALVIMHRHEGKGPGKRRLFPQENRSWSQYVRGLALWIACAKSGCPGLRREKCGVVGPRELESLTSCVSSRRSNQLSYGPGPKGLSGTRCFLEPLPKEAR